MKNFRFLILLLVIIVLLPLFGHFLWVLQKRKPMNLMIVNKSVSVSSENEVKSLNWVLNYEKVLKPDNQQYNFTRDYYGFHPEAVSQEKTIKAYRLEDLSTLENEYDGLIYLDNEGVQYKTPGYSTITHYGGFNQTDYLLVKEMINSGKLVVAEFNFFSDLTEDLVRYNTEQMMDVYSLGWKGKYFRNLDKKKLAGKLDIEWLDFFKKNNEADWDFNGPGLILCNEKQERIIVLPSNEYMEGEFPFIETPEDNSGQFKLPEKAAYEGWFEVVYEGSNKVISYINLNLNESGIDLLRQNGLESVFPVSIKLRDKPAYYMAGDFSKQNVVLTWSKIRILSDLCRSICKGRTKNPGQFFQTYYIPLMSGIIEDYIRNNMTKESS